MSRPGLRLACLLCLLPALPPLRALCEASMALLMLGLMPALFAAGALLPGLLSGRRHAALVAGLRPYGLALGVVASLALGLWMLPIAVDLSRLSGPMGLARDASLILAGLAAHVGLRVAPWPLVLFFGGNMVWMGLTFGMLFIDAPNRLCASYLLGDQRLAGIGLVAYAAGVGLWLLVRTARQAELPAHRPPARH
ncbi:hypothetical protein [Cupriavidus agavae]|uniref:Transmembrane protein n=1 Tax=Cupriavidus agavae TaxID=1001822 RepID=A0A4Q7S8V5_9BURK|nr:hypothetical protein [Cupriavidus agavae]RZT42200.1 hypothetical protein EV147_1223 [Cupriavidus agavae]